MEYYFKWRGRIQKNQEKIQIEADVIEAYDPDIIKITDTYKDKKDINPHAINPDYLKLTEAEESRQG